MFQGDTTRELKALILELTVDLRDTKKEIVDTIRSSTSITLTAIF